MQANARSRTLHHVECDDLHQKVTLKLKFNHNCCSISIQLHNKPLYMLHDIDDYLSAVMIKQPDLI